MKLLSTIIMVLILTLSFGVKSHSQINLFGWEINLFGPKQVELFGIHSRMTDREIVDTLSQRGIICYNKESLGIYRCWEEQTIIKYDGYPLGIIWEVDGHIAQFEEEKIFFSCQLFDGCSRSITIETVANQLVKNKNLPSIQPMWFTENLYYSPNKEDNIHSSDLPYTYCYRKTDYPNEEEVCIFDTGIENYGVRIDMKRFIDRNDSISFD